MSWSRIARQVLSEETIARQGYFRPAAVSGLIDDHVARRQDLSRQIWGLMALTLWVDRYAAVGEPAPS